MNHDDLYDDELVKSITSDVLAVLDNENFFDRLDNLFCPINDVGKREQCLHSFEITSNVLRGLGFDSEEIREVIAVLHTNGACCDCEVLFNVAKESRLKSEYWKARTLNQQPYDPHTQR